MVRRKSARSKSKQSSGLKKIFRFIFILLLVIFFLFLVLLVIFIFVSPKIENKNIVIVSPEKSGGDGVILIAHFYKNTNDISVIRLDKEITGKLIGGYGEYKLGAVKGILDIDKKDSVFIKAAFSHFLEKGIDEVVETNFDTFPQNKYYLMMLLFKNQKTLKEALIVKNLEQGSVNIVEINTFDEWKNYLDDRLTRKINESCSVAVVNATKTVGMATKFSNVLENSGVTVVRSTNNIWGDPETRIYIDEDDGCEEVVERIKTTSPIDLDVKIDSAKTSQFRANIVLFIGDELITLIEE